MIIYDINEKGNIPPFLKGKLSHRLIYIGIGVLGIGCILGLILLHKTVTSRIPIRIEYVDLPRMPASSTPAKIVTKTSGTFVASRSGKAYYYPWCSAAQRIVEKNKIWFDSREEAEAAGFVPGKNCKGL